MDCAFITIAGVYAVRHTALDAPGSLRHERCCLPSFRRTLQRKNMMAGNYRHIGGGENRLGRHYSRFSRIWPTAFVADQSLALRKSRNGGSNRRRRVKLLGEIAGCTALGWGTRIRNPKAIVAYSSRGNTGK